MIRFVDAPAAKPAPDPVTPARQQDDGDPAKPTVVRTPKKAIATRRKVS